ncbi:MAG: aldehyde dehydrogenase family protein [bacterium]
MSTTETRRLSIPGWIGTGEMRPLRSPFSGEVLAEVEQAPADALETAMATAHEAFLANRRTPGWLRREWLERAADMVREEAEQLALGIAREGGKPLADARVEVARAVSTIRLAAEEATSLGGETLPMDKAKGPENRIAFTIREPMGVVVALSAFNHPVNLIAHQVAPALAGGNTVVVKPASTTPLSAIRMVEIFREAGFPPESVICTPCPGAAAEQLVRDPRTRFVTFIGSDSVGWHLRSIMNPGARFSLEHGGEAAVVVAKSADVDRAIPALVKGAFYHAGQVCISVQRIYAHASLREELETRLVKAAAKLTVGDPTDADTDVGPIITPDERQRVADWVGRAVGRGAKLLLGGNELPGQCYEVTVLADPPEDSEVVTHEVFGPVVSVLEFEQEDDVIERVNRSRNPFQAAVFAQDVDAAFRLSRRINANAVVVNDHSAFRVDWMPFGGRENAGFGMGGVRYAVHEMTREKLIVLNLR